MKLSVVIISFKSDHLLSNLISKFPRNYEIIIIENSLQKKTKINFEKKFKNIKVFIPSKNLGYAGGVNMGVKKSKNSLVLIVTADINFSKIMIKNFENCVKNFNDFSLLAPVYKNNKIHRNYKIFNNNENNYFYIKNFKLLEVDEIDGALFLINKKKFKSNKIMDENFFLYFDTTDLCFNLKKDKKKMFVIKNLKFFHKGTSSSDKRYNFEIAINRNWHYSWSKFYYYKKNKNYLFALRKVLPNLLRSLIKYIFYNINLDNKNTKLNKAILSGAINSILLNKSFYRPKIKLEI